MFLLGLYGHWHIIIRRYNLVVSASGQTTKVDVSHLLEIVAEPFLEKLRILFEEFQQKVIKDSHREAP